MQGETNPNANTSSAASLEDNDASNDDEAVRTLPELSTLSSTVE